jgi:hypothetical protein
MVSFLLNNLNQYGYWQQEEQQEEQNGWLHPNYRWIK